MCNALTWNRKTQNGDIPEQENPRSDRQSMEGSGENEKQLIVNTSNDRLNDNLSNPQEETEAIWMDLDQETAKELKKIKEATGNQDWNTLMQEFIQLKKEKLESEKPEPKATRTWPYQIPLQKPRTTGPSRPYRKRNQRSKVLENPQEAWHNSSKVWGW